MDVATFKYHAEEIDNSFPGLRQKVFGKDGFIQNDDQDQKLLSGMLSNETGDGWTNYYGEGRTKYYDPK